MKNGVEIIGLSQVHEVLDGLPKRLNKKLLNQALREEGNKVKRYAVTAIQPFSKRTAKSIKVWNVARSPRAGVWVGAKRVKGYFFEPKSAKRSDKAYAAMAPLWWEFGTYGTKRLPAVGYMRRAIDANVGRIERSFMKTLQKKINQFLDKAIRKYG